MVGVRIIGLVKQMKTNPLWWRFWIKMIMNADWWTRSWWSRITKNSRPSSSPAAMEIQFLIGFGEDLVTDELGKAETYLVLKRNNQGWEICFSDIFYLGLFLLTIWRIITRWEIKLSGLNNTCWKLKNIFFPCYRQIFNLKWNSYAF